MDESALLDLLECPVCLERLDASAKVLPCQHTFCKRCLLGIVSSRNELRCPECRTLVDCSVDELPSNILLVRLLDGIKQRPRKPSTGGGTSSTNALRVPISTVANCGSKDLQSSQVGQQQRVQARSPPVRVSTMWWPYFVAITSFTSPFQNSWWPLLQDKGSPIANMAKQSIFETCSRKHQCSYQYWFTVM